MPDRMNWLCAVVVAVLLARNAAAVEGVLNHHAPKPQIDMKKGFLLAPDRWRVHYPAEWTIGEVPPDGPFVPLNTALKRGWRLEHPRVKGGNVWYRVSLKDIPADCRDGERVLEFEFPMPVLAVFAGGKRLRDATLGTTGVYRVNAKKGRNLLIDSPGKCDYVDVCVADFDYRFDNHVGRALLRKPTLADRVGITVRSTVKADRNRVAFRIDNRSGSPLEGKFVAAFENYFGETLSSESKDIRIEPGGKELWRYFPNTSPAQYKIVAWFTDKSGEKTRPYWVWPNCVDNALTANENDFRRHQLLSWGWTTRWVSEKDGFRTPLPADGWTDKFPPKVYPFDGVVGGLPIFYPGARMPTHRMWARCAFTAPKDLAGKRMKLYLRSVSFHARIYVNGKFVAEKHNHDLPDYVDITDFVKAGGQNELALGITDYIAIRAADAPKLADGQHGGGHVVDAGPFLVRDIRIGLERPPVIVTVGDLIVRNTAIDTTFKSGKNISLRTRIINDRKTARKVTVRQAVYDRGKKVLAFADRELDAPPGGEASVETSAQWRSAVPWDFNTPKLYELRTEIVESGNVVDRHGERFGFREWGVKGRDFLLNGEIVHPYGDGYAQKNPRYFLPVIPANSRISRIALGGKHEKWLHIADESGHAATWEIFMSPYGGMGYRLGEDALYANLLTKWKHVIPEDRNHPALFCYTLGNEPPTSDDMICAKMAAHNEDIYKLDPTKIAHFSRGNNLGGLSRIYSPHYHFGHHNIPSDLNLFGRSQMRPETRERLENETNTGLSYERVWNFWKKDVPVFDSEGASVTDGKEYQPWIFGDEMSMRRSDYRKSYSLACRIAQDVMRGYLYEGYRRVAISAVLAHIGWRWGDEALTPVAVFLYEDEFRLASDQVGRRRLCVLNDTMADETVHARATVAAIDGKTLKDFEKTFKLSPGGMATWDLEIPPLGFESPEYVYLVLEARGEKSGYTYRKPIRFTVFPPFAPKAATLKGAALFDPDGSTAKTLADAGFTLRRIEKLDENALKDVRLLVVAPGALARADKNAKIINRLVAEGMRLLALWQPKLHYAFPFALEDGDNVADGLGAVIVAPGHPVFRGLADEDLRFLQNAERVPLVYQNAPFTPPVGGALPLLVGGSTGTPGSLDYSPLFEVRHGKGLYMVSQLRLIYSMPHDPVAPRLLDNMLRYLASNGRRRSRLAAILDDEAKTRLESRIGLDASCPFDPKAGGVVLLTREAKADAKSCKEFVERGGTLYLKGLTDERINMLAKTFGLKVKLTPRKAMEAFMKVRDPLFEGISQLNWVWWRAGKYTGKKSDALEVGREEIAVEGAKAVSLLEPAYIVRVPVGSGCVVLDTSRWGMVNLKRAQLAALAILENLGASFNPIEKRAGRDWKAYAARFDFTPLNLTKAVNRGLVDDAAGNGKGGWTDEGPARGLDNFPVGKTSFNEVPFLIADPAKTGGNSLVALKGHSWAKLPAKSAEIPVGRKLDKLFFVHGCAWALLPDGAEMARYIIHYADRKEWIPGKRLPFVHAPVVNKRHVYDWWFYDKIASGEYTMPGAVIAWRAEGASKNRGVAMMEWTNPFPNRPIDAIQVEATSPRSQFFLIGATGATFKAGQRVRVPLFKLDRKDYPVGLKDCKDHLWKLETPKLILYLDRAQRARGVATRGGRMVLDDAGFWYIQGYIQKKFTYGGRQSAKCIERSRAYATPDGAVTIEVRDVDAKHVTWSQRITVKGSSLKIANEMVFRKSLRDFVGNGKCAVTTAVSLHDSVISDEGKLVSEANGMMVLPAKGFGVVVRYNDQYRRYRKGVSYWEQGATCKIRATGFDAANFEIGKKYLTDVEVEITPQ